MKPELTNQESVILEDEYNKLRYKLIRRGDYHPETTMDLADLTAKRPYDMFSEIDTLAMLVERYKKLISLMGEVLGSDPRHFRVASPANASEYRETDDK